MSQKNVLPILDKLPFSVDTYDASTQDKIQFSTHAHKDHLIGVVNFPSNKAIWCTSMTKRLILMKYPALKRHELRFRTVSVGDDLELKPEIPGGWRVSVLEANHCPGAAMFLFHGPPGCTILHTGDCRLTHDVVQQVSWELDRIGRSTIDLLYLDCTFADKPMAFPPLESSLASITSFIASELQRGVVKRCYIACEMLGTEEVIEELHQAIGLPLYFEPPDTCSALSVAAASVSQSFKTPQLHVERYNELRMLLPQGVLLAEGSSPDSTPLHIVGGDKMTEFSEMMTRRHGHGGFLILKPSVQKVLLRQSNQVHNPSLLSRGRQLQAPRGAQQGDAAGLKHVLYSRHSSHEELMAAVRAMRPRAIVAFSGTAPPELLALAGLGPSPRTVLDEIGRLAQSARQLCRPPALMQTNRVGSSAACEEASPSLQPEGIPQPSPLLCPTDSLGSPHPPVDRITRDCTRPMSSGQKRRCYEQNQLCSTAKQVVLAVGSKDRDVAVAPHEVLTAVCRDASEEHAALSLRPGLTNFESLESRATSSRADQVTGQDPVMRAATRESLTDTLQYDERRPMQPETHPTQPPCSQRPSSLDTQPPLSPGVTCLISAPPHPPGVACQAISSFLECKIQREGPGCYQELLKSTSQSIDPSASHKMHPEAHTNSQPSPPESGGDGQRTLSDKVNACENVSLEATVEPPGVGDWLMRHVVAAATQVSPRSARLKELLERARH